MIAGAVPYFQIRMLAGPLMAMNYAFRGYWNGIGQSRLYMTTLLIMHASNVLLNYMFIYGHFGAPALGVIGSGLGTALSVFLGTAIYYGFGWRYALEGGFLRRWPRREDYSVLVRISVPPACSMCRCQPAWWRCTGSSGVSARRNWPPPMCWST